jgi:hypothetical protein
MQSIVGTSPKKSSRIAGTTRENPRIGSIIQIPAAAESVVQTELPPPPPPTSTGKKSRKNKKKNDTIATTSTTNGIVITRRQSVAANA